MAGVGVYAGVLNHLMKDKAMIANMKMNINRAIMSMAVASMDSKPILAIRPQVLVPLYAFFSLKAKLE